MVMNHEPDASVRVSRRDLVAFAAALAGSVAAGEEAVRAVVTRMYELSARGEPLGLSGALAVEWMKTMVARDLYLDAAGARSPFGFSRRRARDRVIAVLRWGYGHSCERISEVLARPLAEVRASADRTAKRHRRSLTTPESRSIPAIAEYLEPAEDAVP